MIEMHRLGARIREAQDELEQEHDLTQERARLVARLERSESPQRRAPRASGVRWRGYTALALSAAAVLLCWWLRARPVPLAFRVAEAPGQLERWVQARASEDLPVRFSDGSSLLLRASTRARVQNVSANGARVELAHGELAVSVVHRADTHWLVQAGPYSVQVVGTRFDVAYAPDSSAFSLVLHDGSVRIAGPGLGAGRSVVAGERVTLQGVVASAHTARPALDEHAGAADAGAALAAEHDATVSAPSVKASTWMSNLQRGDYTLALDRAEHLDAHALLHGAHAGELAMLGDAAFHAQRDALAERVYRLVRQSAPGSTFSATAAFNLGRLAFRRAPHASDAASWFETYLAEAPGGPLEREALGRLLEAQRASGALAAARATAAVYLQRYPHGPHAQVADEVKDTR